MDIQIKARARDWNARSNGTEMHRRCILPGARHGVWASEAGPLDGGWPKRDFRADARHAVQHVRVPEGTIIVEFEKRFRGGQPTGAAQVSVGLVTAGPDGEALVSWDRFKWRQTGPQVFVTLDDGTEVEA